MLLKEELKQILASQQKSILNRPYGIERNILKEIESKITLPHIIVITGMRRTGKSTLLKQIIEKYYKNKDFYYINFEDERLFNFEAKQFTIMLDELFNIQGDADFKTVSLPE